MDEGAPKSVAKTGEEPTKIIEINGKKFEVGPYLGELSWGDMERKILTMNKNRNIDELHWLWTILTQEEYLALGKPIEAIWDDETLEGITKREKVEEYIKKIGFTPDKFYWSGTVYADSKDLAWAWYSSGGYVRNLNKHDKLCAQCIREV